MKKSILFGTITACSLFILALITSLDIFIYIVGGLGIVCLLLSGVLGGALISGDQFRANIHTETKDHRDKRNTGMYMLALFGLPNFIASILLTILK